MENKRIDFFSNGSHWKTKGYEDMKQEMAPIIPNIYKKKEALIYLNPLWSHLSSKFGREFFSDFASDPFAA